MNSKRLLVSLAIVLLLTLCVVMVACNRNGGGNVQRGGENTEDVSKAVFSVYQSLKANRTISGAEMLYVGFDGSIKTDDTEADSDFATLFDFDAKIFVGEGNPQPSTLAFTVKKDMTAQSLFELYYRDGKTYVKYAPILSRSGHCVCIEGFDLEGLTRKLVESGDSSNGMLRRTLDLIPTFAESFLTDCTKILDGNQRTYTFKIDYSRLAPALDAFLSGADIGITRQNVMDILGLTAADLAARAENGEGKLVVATQVSSGVEYFQNATYTYTEGNKTKTIVLSSFRADAITEFNADKYSVTLAENLSSYENDIFDFANLSVSGTMSVKLSSVNTSATFMNDPLNLALQLASFDSRFDFVGVQSKNGYNASLALSQINGGENGVEFYYDGDLYADLSSYVEGKNKVKLENSYVKDALTALSVLVDKVEISSREKLYLLANLFANRTDKNGLITYTLDKDMLSLLFKSAGYDPAFDYTGVRIELNTQAGTFKGLDVSFMMKGATVKFSSEYPTVGAAAKLSAPEWTSEVFDISQAKCITPVLTGEFSSNVLNGVTNTQLVESLIYSMSGTNVELTGDIKSFKMSASYASNGALKNIQIDFLTQNDAIVCTMFYNYVAADDVFYVILPEEGGVTPVHQLQMLPESRFGEFAHTVHGNTQVDTEAAAYTLSNTQKGFIIEANAEGANLLFRRLKQAFTGMRTISVPLELGIEKFALNLQEGALLRTYYANNRYIDVKITSLTLTDTDLSLYTRQVATHSGQEISIYQDNDMPQTIDVVLGSGAAKRNMRVNVSDFGGWQYEDLPETARTTGVQTITAYVTVFGQKVVDYLQVNYDAQSSIEVSYNVRGAAIEDLPSGVNKDEEYRSYLHITENAGSVVRTFEFPRYNSPVDPIKLINNKFNLAVVGNIQKEIYWIDLNRKERLSENSFTQSGDASKDTFTLIPVMQDFFGADIRLNTAYIIRLEGSTVREVENYANFLTITAYSNQDPLAPSTYLSVPTRFVLQDAAEPIVLSDLVWDIDSIKNISVGKATTEKLIQLLDESLYAVSGTYRISVKYKNSLHSVESKDVIITVKAREISAVSPTGLLTGVTAFHANENRADGETFGMFVFDPFTIQSLYQEMQIAKTLVCSFRDAEAEDTALMSYIKWQVPDFSNVQLKASANLTGTLSAVVGNNVGGFQELVFDYLFINYPISTVALYSGTAEIESKPYSANVAFSYLSANPYDFTYPNDVVFTYGEFNYSYKNKQHTVEGGQKVYKDVKWGFADYNENSIWQYGESKVYQGSVTVTDATVNVSVSFIKKMIAQDSWAFVDEDGNEFLDGAPVATPQSYVLDENGDYYFLNGRYVLATQTIEGADRYSASGETTEVRYKKPNEGDVKRIIIDPTVTNYLCLDSYPAKVQVTFQDGETQVLDAIWDLSPLAQDETVGQMGYFKRISLYVAGNQKVADVDMWIAATRPSAYYIKPAFIADELNAVESSNRLYASVIDEKDGGLVVNDVRTLSYLHSLICDCSEEGCLGKIYFHYNDNNVQSRYFEITEWQGLEKIAELFATQLAAGTPVEKVYGDVPLVAKVSDTVCNVTFTVCAASIQNMELTGLAHASSSLYDDQYSMKAEGMTLTIDPYLASPLDKNYYPSTIDFEFVVNNGAQRKVKAIIDYWDYSCFQNVNLFGGAEGVVYAIVSSPYEKDIRFAVDATLEPRVIEKVYVDGESSKRIYVDAYSKDPFGENVRKENGRTIALKRVDVKFAGDDKPYSLLLKYDITDYVASFAGGLIASNVTVYVGSEAGGYQALSGYSIYSKQNTVLSITSPDAAVQEVTLGSGIVYTETISEKVFRSFGDSAEENAAWETLTVLGKTLNVECGAYDSNGNKTAGTSVLTATAYTDGAYGLVYAWERRQEGNANYLYFKLWYQHPLLDAQLGEAQEICTENEKYVTLTGASFKLSDISNADLTFAEGYKVKDLFDTYTIVNTTAFTFNDLSLTITDDKDREYTLDSILNAGVYSVVITVNDDRYNGSIPFAFTVKQRAIYALEVMVNNKYLTNLEYELKEFSVLQGRAVNIYADGYKTEGVEIGVQVTILQGETVAETQEDGYYAAGDYTVRFTPDDENYKNPYGDFTLTIKTVE